MKLLWNAKAGGPESRVWMYGFESKRFGSALLLRFENGSREAYHSHAFNALSVVLSGGLNEWHMHGGAELHGRGKVVRTLRETFHKVYSIGRTWVLSFRSPWIPTWQEALPVNKSQPLGLHHCRTLTHGREVVA